MHFTFDERYMFRCLELARHGLGSTAPNPMVGAVLVHEGRIIGEGFHQVCGGPHAEVNCLNNVAVQDRHLIPASTLFVSLEPCAHHGRTPPCADRIIREGIRDVVVAIRDPFPLVAGKGIEMMEAAGIRVRIGPLGKEAELLNKRFLTFHKKRRPYIILKWARSADGMIAGPGPSRVSISGLATRALVHQWRYEEAGIMVGAGTVETDDPQLTVRPSPSPRQPVRIILDPRLRLDSHYRVFDGEAPAIICNTLKDGTEGHLRYLRLPPGEDLVPEMLRRLHELSIQSILVEGGQQLLNAFLKADAWDEIRRITSTDKRIPGGYPEPDWAGKEPSQRQHIDQDIIETFIHG
jgi:diaminohydroxyphosphoribosylaminopyrimidine deaminase / 5-amino-6-(5-phosphoribosylamino)uracil reductase